MSAPAARARKSTKAQLETTLKPTTAPRKVGPPPIRPARARKPQGAGRGRLADRQTLAEVVQTGAGGDHKRQGARRGHRLRRGCNRGARTGEPVASETLGERAVEPDQAQQADGE